jgi:hypothetical protein
LARPSSPTPLPPNTASKSVTASACSARRATAHGSRWPASSPPSSTSSAAS